jgi:hypothetical protein
LEVMVNIYELTELTYSVSKVRHLFVLPCSQFVLDRCKVALIKGYCLPYFKALREICYYDGSQRYPADFAVEKLVECFCVETVWDEKLPAEVISLVAQARLG